MAASKYQLGLLGGLVAAASGVGAAEGVATLIGVSSPVVSVGTWAIDRAPAWLRDFAIENFGAADKVVLAWGILLTLAVFGAAVGLLGVVRPRTALAVTAAIGVVGVVAAATVRGTLDGPVERVIPALVALVVSVAGFGVLLWMLHSREVSTAPPAVVASGGRRSPLDEDDPDPAPPGAAFDRRGFVRSASVLGALGLTGGAWSMFGGGVAQPKRASFAIPRPADPAPPVPAEPDFDLAGLSRYFTPNSEFYRIDTAFVVPRVNARFWSLRVHGMVERELEFDLGDLLARPMIERDVTLTCVSNEVGDDLIGNARWVGVPIAEVLREAGPLSGADAVKSTSVDGWNAGTPLEALTDPDRGAMFAVAMNGKPLPAKHGYPVRMVVPGLYGFVSATKWVVDVEVTRFDRFDAYWTQRGWAERAPIKTESRIEVPEPFTRIRPGRTVIAGVAWAQTRGIRTVEVRVDDGPWNTATLADQDNPDTWRHWRWTWDAPPGDHAVAVRATDATGQVQTAQYAPPIPDGASGYHQVLYRVTSPQQG